MTTYTIKIPDSKRSFFEELVVSLNLSFIKTEEEEDFEIPQWQQQIVLDRLKNPKMVVDAFEMVEQLEKNE